MQKMRAEANPGTPKSELNCARTTRSAAPAFRRGTLSKRSKLAWSVPEVLAHAVCYAFLV
ncbi:MAG: hypothetical protein NVSMB6_14780 [Burkholderiaceae bacterium]